MKKIITAALASAMVFCLAACSSSEELNDEPLVSGLIDESIVKVHDLDAEQDNEEPISVLDLNGLWITDTQRDGSDYVAAIQHDDETGTIDVFRNLNGVQELYWSGSFTPADEDTERYKWTSEADHEKETLNEDDELDFNYVGGGYMYFLNKDDTRYSEDGLAVWFRHMTDTIGETLGEAEEVEEPEEEEEEETEKEEKNAAATMPDEPEVSVSSETEPSAETLVCSHEYGAGVTVKEATCTEAGIKTYTCAKCGNVRQSVIDPLGHTYMTETVKEATCGEDGITDHICVRCGDEYQTTVQATGDHDWAAVTSEVKKGHYETVTTDPVYEMQYVCSDCGAAFETADEASAHVESAHDGKAGWASVNTMISRGTEERVWVEDGEEEIIEYYKCSVCGAIKESGD